MSLVKTVATVGGWTLVYRLSSFVRDILQARYLGAGMFADVFALAFKFANILRKIFAEGAFNASFLPIFSNTLKDKGEEEARKLASQTFTWLVLFISFLMILCLIFFREIMSVYCSGFEPGSEKSEHLVVIGRICSSYIGASFLVALFGGILNTFNRFAMPAAVQVVLNLSVIMAFFVGPLQFPSVAYTMAWATFFAGFIQFLILWINVRCCGMKVWFNFSPVMDGVKTFFKKLVSGAIGAGVWQLNVIIDFAVLTLLPTGSASYFYYTDHVNQFPIGILGIAFSTALLPPLTRAIHANDKEGAQKQMGLGLLFAFVFTLPAAVILMLLSEPITGAIYGHGKFTAEHVTAAAPALTAFAFGLPSYMMTKVFSTTFFAHKDTRTPLIGGMISIISNLLFILLLVPYMKHVGVALATSLSAWCNGLYLIFKLKSLGTVKIEKSVILDCIKQVIVSVVMLLSIYGMNIFAKSYYIQGGDLRNMAVISVVGVSLLVFFIVGKILGIFKFLQDVKTLK
ncbi:MAG: murein biosynthesis integral membrane protein MurJ [Alphaproteobacteria bacterium]|nr:murein biosynthesis integral membrane protein MurJ [Alphaproteobacteria bacterium]MBO7537088.1 murein biosynthesis integral membrane protein MurJ [Alphaproteobacteria bacterium]MBO7641866.1 murein biosynthesis integral membrane protein MurJ [Alphaproteobacteria bacterium]